MGHVFWSIKNIFPEFFNMLTVISGKGSLKAKKIREEIEKLNKNGFSVVRKDDSVSGGELTEYAKSNGLFGDKFAVYVSGFDGNGELTAFLIKEKEMFVSSDTPFLFEGTKLPKGDEKELAEYITVFEEADERENFFPLADALGARNKRLAWAKLTEALERASPEEIHGILWWQVKSMKLVAGDSVKSPEAVGMKPFVFKKMKTAAANFSEKEITGMSSDLFRMYHNAHLGKGELGLLLEKFVLERL